MKVLLRPLSKYCLSACWAFVFFGAVAPSVWSVGFRAQMDSVKASRKVRFQLGNVETVMPFQEVDGMVVVGGDMVIGPVSEMRLETDPNQEDGAVQLVAVRTRGWSGGVIPYVLTEDFLRTHSRKLWMSALYEIHKNTNLRLVERTNERSYLRVTSNILGGGCKAELGRKAWRPQILNLGKDCGVPGIFIHEILHALGLPHEHQRHDRDKYVRFFPRRVESGNVSSFAKIDKRAWLNPFPYDYGSIMHYGMFTFAKARQPVLEPLQPLKRGQYLGQVQGLSPQDIDLIHYMIGVQNVLDGKTDQVKETSRSRQETPSFEWLNPGE